MLRRILGMFEGITSREGGRWGIPTFTVYTCIRLIAFVVAI